MRKPNYLNENLRCINICLTWHNRQKNLFFTSGCELSSVIITTTGSLSDASKQTGAQKCDKSEWTIVSRHEWAGLYIWPRETERWPWVSFTHAKERSWILGHGQKSLTISAHRDIVLLKNCILFFFLNAWIRE